VKKRNNTQPVSSSKLEESLHSFIEVFYRIFKIGIYYPVGHVVIDQAAENFIKSLRETFSTSRTVVLEFRVDGLFIEKTHLSDKNAAVRELYQLMTRLGVQAIEFDRIIPHIHFLQFVKSLLTWRAELDRTKSFKAFNITDLPSSIKVSQEKYVAEGSGSAGEDPDGELSRSLDKMYDALAEQGFSPEQVTGCRELMTNLSTMVIGEIVDIENFPNATWHDVQSLLIKSVTRVRGDKSVHEGTIVQSDVNALSTIFVSLEKGLTDSKSKETIRLLLAHLATGAKKKEDTEAEEKVSPDEDKTGTQNIRFEASVTDIASFIENNSVPLKVLEQMSFTDRSQELSIILQLLNTREESEVSARCRKILQTTLSSQMTSQEWGIVFSGMLHIAESKNIEQFRDIVEMVMETLRDGQDVNSKVFIITFWKKVPKNMHVLLWPFVVNELLFFGMEQDLNTFYELTRVASHMPADVMRQLWPQLEVMAVYKDKKVAPAFFRPSFIDSYQFFSILLDMPIGEIIAPRILTALKEDPQDDFFKVVGPVLQPSHLEHLLFLRLYLNHTPFKEVPLALKMGAGKIILEFLENILNEQRVEAWLPRTIEATASMPVKGIKEMLVRVVEERKMKVVPVWPKNCRKAAENALQLLKRQKLSHLL